MQIEEYIIEEFIPHGLQTLDQLGLEGGGTHSSGSAESVWESVEIDSRTKTAIQNYHHRIT